MQLNPTAYAHNSKHTPSQTVSRPRYEERVEGGEMRQVRQVWKREQPANGKLS